MSKATPKPSLQSQLAELDELLHWFDQPDLDLDQALDKFEQGTALTEEIKQRLVHFENKITILKKRFDQDT